MTFWTAAFHTSPSVFAQLLGNWYGGRGYVGSACRRQWGVRSKRIYVIMPVFEISEDECGFGKVADSADSDVLVIFSTMPPMPADARRDGTGAGHRHLLAKHGPPGPAAARAGAPPTALTIAATPIPHRSSLD
jgi:hypothetical protein